MLLPSFATNFSTGAPASRTAPFVPSVYNFQGYNGGAVGQNTKVISSAVAELIERTHFLTLKKGLSRTSLHDAYDESTGQAFSHALGQTAKRRVKDDLHRHQFHMVPAINLFTGAGSVLPLVMVSLARTSDDAFLPYRDSTGCACHFDPDLALDSALLEFYERQCLVAATLTGRCREVIGSDGLLSLGDPISELARPFFLNGTLRLAEIGFHEGVYVVLTTYEGRKDSPVRYSVGCAASFDPRRAIAKSLAELQQGYVFFEFWDRLDRTNRRNGKNDEEQKQIVADNATNTWRAFSFFDDSYSIQASVFIAQPRGSRQELLNHLSSIGSQLYAYHGSLKIDDRKTMCFFKVASVDFPLTRRIEYAYNADNAFFKSIGLGPSCQNIHIPFF